jgi:hypothetical protein
VDLLPDIDVVLNVVEGGIVRKLIEKFANFVFRGFHRFRILRSLILRPPQPVPRDVQESVPYRPTVSGVCAAGASSGRIVWQMARVAVERLSV